MQELFLILILLISFGCTRSDENGEDKGLKEENKVSGTIIAVVNERPIYKEDINKISLEEAIDRELLYQEAMKKGLDKQFEGLNQADKKRRIRRFFRDDIIGKSMVVGEGEVEAFYRENKGDYESILTIEIILKDKTLAEDVKKRATSGEDFKKLMEEYSKEPAKAKVDTKVDPQYREIFKDKDVGYISDVISDEEGFKVTILKERVEIPLESVRRSIESKVTREKRERSLREFLKKLKKENKIAILSHQERPNADQN